MGFLFNLIDIKLHVQLNYIMQVTENNISAISAMKLCVCMECACEFVLVSVSH